MNWAEPFWRLGLVPVIVLAIVAIWATRRHRSALIGAFGTLYETILPRGIRIRRNVRTVLSILGLAAVVLALAEPRFDKEIRTVEANGVDIVLLLDLSRSMDAQDVEPSRLERARREVADLFRVMGSDRVGLVVYAGGAWPRLPLTEDLRAVQLVLSEADSDTFVSQGSALDQAIEAGIELLERSETPAGKALLVFSDGEFHDNVDKVLAAADIAGEKGIAIYTMGIGEGPAPIPVPGGFLQYEGQQVSSVPDETVLREVAKRSGGAYVHSVASANDITQLYRNEMRTRLVATQRSATQRESWRSAYQWPLGAGLLALLLSAWLGDGRRPYGAVAALLIAVMLPVSPAMAGTVTEADRQYRSGDYKGAADALTELSLERPTDRDVFQRLGAARYQAGDFEGAARAYDQADRLSGGTDTDSAFNAGNSHWQAGRLEEAQQRYQRVLQRDPEHPGAAQNQAILTKEIEARRAPPPPPPPDQGGEGEEERPDDQPQDKPDDGEGNPEDGEPQSGQPQGEPDEQSDPQEGTPDLSDVEPNGEDGEPEDQEEGNAGQPGEEGDEGEPITEGQAEKLLDGVEEGSQRVRFGGANGGKPW